LPVDFSLSPTSSQFKYSLARNTFEMLSAVNPRPFLVSLTGKHVSIKLKWGMEYRGLLLAVDAYMNVQLADTEEFIDGELAGNLGEVLIRCNNVMYIREAPSS